MVVDGAFGDEQPPGDLPVRQAFGQQRQDLSLAGRQPGRGGPRGGRGPRGMALIPSVFIRRRAAAAVA